MRYFSPYLNLLYKQRRILDKQIKLETQRLELVEKVKEQEREFILKNTKRRNRKGEGRK